jgi:hypothetical protein
MLHLESAKDALYNAGGTPIAADPTGKSGTDVGDILNVFTNFHLTTHQDILVGYIYLWEGDFIKNTKPAVGPPQLAYVQWSFKW